MSPNLLASTKRLLVAVNELSRARTLDQIVNISRHAARELTGADGATFILRSGDLCHYVDEDAVAPLWKGQRFHMSTCISGWTMLHRKAAVVKDIYSDPRIPIEAYASTFVKSLAIVPIRAHNPIGAIGNYWATPHEATEDEMQLLQALADLISVALENLRLYEEKDHHAAELERVSRTKDEFLMTLSHELRTPLTTILGWSELLLATPAVEGATLHRGLQAIASSAHAQVHLIDALLDASRIIAGKLSITLEPVNLVELAQRSVQTFQAALLQNSLCLSLDSAESQLWINGDSRRLMQVFHNVISNAIKFTPVNGHIKVMLKAEGPSVHVAVTDDGVGIHASDLPHLFERFSRLDSSETRQHGGLGLGLSIVRYIVEAHGGHVSACSEGLGKGTVIELRLPRIAAP